MFGFLRETQEKADKDNRRKNKHNITKTGLDTYLKEIFPNITDWIHDKPIPNTKRSFRPDYRSETLKMVIDFDGLPHYQNPARILTDKKRHEFFKSLGYIHITIPFFIQLTNKAIKTLFNVEITKQLFDDTIPSLYEEDGCTPAFLCPSGIKRMAEEFKQFPEQYKINMEQMKKQSLYLTRWDLLEKEYENLA